jgi:exodeoxyribonuclease VII large subunit
MEIEVKPQFITVTELNRLVREEIENNPYLTNIWVKGEIFNLTYHSSGHIYFTLKDEGAAVSAVFFRNYNKNMKFRLEDGMSVLVLGGLTVFEKRGSYQLNAISVRPEGAGELQKRIEQLKKKLSDEGVFDQARKKSRCSNITYRRSPARHHQGCTAQVPQHRDSRGPGKGPG